MTTKFEDPPVVKNPPNAKPQRPAPEPRRPAPVHHSVFDDEEEKSFLQRNSGTLILVVVVAVGGVFFVVNKLSHSDSAPVRKAPEIVMIRPLPPPPAPTPPPPPPQSPPEQKMIEQTPVDEHEEKPEPKEAPQPDLGTNIQGNGPDAFGLGHSGSGTSLGHTEGGGSGSRWGWYASQVQSRIAEALRENRKTRAASINRLTVRIWPDNVGRITRVALGGTTGDASVDAAIKNEILNGLQLREPPPPGMPSPIVLRISAERKN